MHSPLTYAEYEMIRDFIGDKAQKLGKHESKDMVRVGLDPTNYRVVKFMGKRFAIISTRVIRAILYDVLPKATEQYPDHFGKQSTSLVIEALYKIEPENSLDFFAEFIRNEQFFWIVGLEEGNVLERVLRIEPYRKIDKNPDGTSDFTGGLSMPLNTSRIMGYPFRPIIPKMKSPILGTLYHYCCVASSLKGRFKSHRAITYAISH
jgi:hypothetical protein